MPSVPDIFELMGVEVGSVVGDGAASVAGFGVLLAAVMTGAEVAVSAAGPAGVGLWQAAKRKMQRGRSIFFIVLLNETDRLSCLIFIKVWINAIRFLPGF